MLLLSLTGVVPSVLKFSVVSGMHLPGSAAHYVTDISISGCASRCIIRKTCRFVIMFVSVDIGVIGT